MGPCSEVLTSVTATNILPMRNWFQMARSHTAAIAAQVVKFQALWDRTNEVLVHNPMGLKRHIASADMTPTIRARARPFPATITDEDLVFQGFKY